ncbi:hypothetical protein QIG54_29195, partial [Klebsiella pneumoniae]|nr:hypothetical protein [Klebsiella pneumoniae]
MRRHVIRGRDDNRWAEQAAPVPWEIRQRSGIVAAAIIAAFVAVCATGIAVGALFGWGPFVLYGH